jgi:hypothetical protein
MDRKLRPEPEYRLKRNTRFGNTPNHRDTFYNYKPAPKTAGYLSEQDMFRKTFSSVGVKCEFQQEDKARKERYTAGRLNRRAQRIQGIEARAQQSDLAVDMFDQ